MAKKISCPLCGKQVTTDLIRPTFWIDKVLWKELSRKHPEWNPLSGACALCFQDALLVTLLKKRKATLQESVQNIWPIDAKAAFGVLPTSLRMRSDPHYAGNGITIAFLDSGFYPHSDLIRPLNRIRAWVDVSQKPHAVKYFESKHRPDWPGWKDRAAYQWHGMMTSCVAAGNGWISHGFYRGIASDAELVLVQVAGPKGKIGNESILHGLEWIAQNGKDLGIKVVNISLGGDRDFSADGKTVDNAVSALVNMDITVVAASGNDGIRQLVPPATAPAAITVGGIDDTNLFDRQEVELWHSNYGSTVEGCNKPEFVAPSIYVVAPMLPGTPTARHATRLFKRRDQGENVTSEMQEAMLVTPHYKHVDGTSFAAPLVSGVIACMLEANPSLTPDRIKELLLKAAWNVPGARRERQGAGAIDAGKAIALAVWDRKQILADAQLPPVISETEITYLLHDSQAYKVEVFGNWNNWRSPGISAIQIQPSIWHAKQTRLAPGRYWYKFRLDGSQWMSDPANPRKSVDRSGRINSVLIVP